MTMDFNFKPTQKLLIALTNGDIFEGIYQNGSKNRIDLIDISEHPSGSKISGMLSFYRTEIDSVKLLETGSSNSDEECEKPENGGSGNSKDVILLPKVEYERLKEMSRYSSFALSRNQERPLRFVCRTQVYMATTDNRFFKAIEHLENCETVGVAGIGSELGRQKSISLLVMTSWDQVYLFDILSYRLPSLHPKLKGILETDSIKKVVHDSRTLVDCLYHCHKVKLTNIFDTQVRGFEPKQKIGNL